jgi:hypothetical protein
LGTGGLSSVIKRPEREADLHLVTRLTMQGAVQLGDHELASGD